MEHCSLGVGLGCLERKGWRMGHRKGGEGRRVLPCPKYDDIPWSLAQSHILSQQRCDFLKGRNCVTFTLNPQCLGLPCF